MESLKHLVVAAQAGNIEAYGDLVDVTQRMACAVALGGYCETRPWRRMPSNRPICGRFGGSPIWRSLRRSPGGFAAS
jgi:hypothetical protein